MFTQSFEYALRCLVFLSRHGQAVLPIRHIAEAAEVPRDYLYKLVPALCRHDLARTTRGKHGGLRLARAPDGISVFDVLIAVQSWNRLVGCPLTNRKRCPRAVGKEGLCPLHSLLDRLAGIVEARLRTITLEDFLRERTDAITMLTRRSLPAAGRRRRRTAGSGP
jgi:Rrf2 family nitric oxide-sensitive transcriptional repressor